MNLLVCPWQSNAQPDVRIVCVFWFTHMAAIFAGPFGDSFGHIHMFTGQHAFAICLPFASAHCYGLLAKSLQGLMTQETRLSVLRDFPAGTRQDTNYVNIQTHRTTTKSSAVVGTMTAGALSMCCERSELAKMATAKLLQAAFVCPNIGQGRSNNANLTQNS